jgi:GNAT superfamily N-acetyltransferase
VADPDLLIHPLKRTDDRAGFHSGNPDLDRFFQRFAGQNQFRHHIGTTYVAVMGGRTRGFATVSPGEVTAESLSEVTRARLPAYPLPVLRLSRLAVDQRDQGKGVGRLLLRAMLGLALDLRDLFGCTGVVVDAKPDAVGFYEGLGFLVLEPASGVLGDRPEPLPMFLSTKAIATAGKS